MAIKITTKCLICEENVVLYDSFEEQLYNPYEFGPAICDKCKAVVLKLRKQEEQKEK